MQKCAKHKWHKNITPVLSQGIYDPKLSPENVKII
jgi:hypothetical protein